MSQQDTTQTMTIGELSRITGLSTSAIRFYQRRGVLPARDEDAGWQRFDSATLDRLALIELVKGAGFSLDEVVRIMDALDADPDTVPERPAVWQGLAEAKILQIDTMLARLAHLRDVLQGSLELGYLPADRARRLPGVLGWTAPHLDEPDRAVDVPAADVPLAGPTA